MENGNRSGEKMIRYGHFDYAAAPRTGTSWFVLAAYSAGYGNGGHFYVHDLFPTKHDGTLRISTVRHPADWLMSYYNAIYPAKIGVEQVDRFAGLTGRSFDQFVANYLQHMPGSIGKMMCSYDADSFIRIEDTPLAFADLMKSMGVSEKVASRCYGITRANASHRKPYWSPSLLDRVIEAEHDFVTHFEYVECLYA